MRHGRAVMVETTFQKLPPRLGALIDESRAQVIGELGASGEQQDHAADLHAQTIVCDSYGMGSSCHWAGLPYSAELEAHCARRLHEVENGRERDALIQTLRQETLPRRVSSFARDRACREDVQTIWRAAGVTLGMESFGNAWVFGPDLRGTIDDFLPALARVNDIHDNVDFLEKVVRFDQINTLKQRGRIGVIWHCQQPDFFFAGLESRDHPELAEAGRIDDPVSNLDMMFGLGFRMTQLTNGTSNQVGCSHNQDPDTGVTEVGRGLIARMNELGMMIDLAHSGPRTMLDAIEASVDPVVTSHGACRDVAVGGKSKSRNMTDAAIRALADKGGYLGITLPPNLLGGFGIEQFHKHLEHAITVVGIDHVGIGTDETGLGLRGEPVAFHTKPNNFPGPSRTAYGGVALRGTREYWTYDHGAQAMLWTNWPYWATLALVMRGYRDEDIRKLIGGNFLRAIKPMLERAQAAPVS